MLEDAFNKLAAFRDVMMMITTDYVVIITQVAVTNTADTFAVALITGGLVTGDGVGWGRVGCGGVE